MNDGWYQVMEPGTPLTQGDVIFDCPLLGWSEPAPRPSSNLAEQAILARLASAFREDVIVMTQACDLEHRKVENVVVCPHVTVSVFQGIWQEWMTARGPERFGESVETGLRGYC